MYFFKQSITKPTKKGRNVAKRPYFHVNFAFLHKRTSLKVAECAWFQLLKINNMFKTFQHNNCERNYKRFFWQFMTTNWKKISLPMIHSNKNYSLYF